MRDLKDFLFGCATRSDSHANLFGNNVLKDYPAIDIDSSIAMINSDIKHKDKSLFEYFESYCKLNKKGPIAANGRDIEEICKVVKSYPDRAKCIGEIKCYKHYIGHTSGEQTYDDFKLAFDISANPLTKDLPIFVHIDLANNSAAEGLDTLLKCNNKRKVVLCHMGINALDSHTEAFKRAIDLQHKYQNLWFELSWHAFKFIDVDARKLFQVDTDRLILGTDLTAYDSKSDIDRTIGYFDYWNQRLNNRTNIKRLLGR